MNHQLQTVKLQENLNYPKNAIGNYKNNQIPNATILVKLAQLLGTSVEYLMTGKQAEQLTIEENKIIDAYRKAEPEIKIAIRKLLDIKDQQDQSSTYKTGLKK
ncbi:helix-turn-helix domain-containing protein [Clostridium sp. MCC353]|uniref:helix-turn-helix domain-containing protein n=1 Tax=Clostridium sp. MCC353 TaxID=2592646 RepID=UPI0031FEDA1D|nr:helix-turn-helix domain-containing protein [Clostridium sp. MCC353]